MTLTNTTVYRLEVNARNSSKGRFGKIANKKMWKSLRKHILSCREKRKQAEYDAEVLRTKMYSENLKIQEIKMSLAQINGRLSELQDKKDLLEEEKRSLLEQKQNTDDTALKKLETNNKSGTTFQLNGSGAAVPFSQHRQTIIDMRSDIFLSGDTLNDKPLSVVIPTKMYGRKHNYWITYN